MFTIFAHLFQLFICSDSHSVTNCSGRQCKNKKWCKKKSNLSVCQCPWIKKKKKVQLIYVFAFYLLILLHTTAPGTKTEQKLFIFSEPKKYICQLIVRSTTGFNLIVVLCISARQKRIHICMISKTEKNRQKMTFLRTKDRFVRLCFSKLMYFSFGLNMVTKWSQIMLKSKEGKHF